MKPNLILLLLGLFFLLNQAQAQKLSPLITLGKPEWNCNEPTVCIDPKDSDLVWVSCNNNRLFRVNYLMQYQHVELESEHGVRGDLVLYALANNQISCTHLAKHPEKRSPDYYDRIVFQVNKKGLKKWSKGVGIGFNGKMQDKPWVHQNKHQTARFKHRIYVSWTEFDRYESSAPEDSSRIKIAWSDDGETFSNPVTVSDLSGNCLDGDSTVEGATTVSDSQGNVYMAWAGYERIYFDKSLDGGQTWGADQRIGNAPQGWDLKVPNFMRTNGLPFLSIDSSNNLYLITAFEDSSLNRVFFTRSKDLGKTWDDFFPLQQAPAAHYVCPHAIVDPITQTYYAIYYKIEANKVDVLLSYKKQHEEGFHTLKVSDEPFELSNPKRFLGDYISVDARNNTLALAWTALENGFAVVKFRKMKF
ncbi:MAG: exo-alpha-sialidase [Chitinophagaceae bacterium]|nr:exo-alpha-sialidase [Chitinophagaceae bacterium]